MQAEEKQQLQHKQGGGGREQVSNLQDGMNVTGQPNASWRKEADDNSLHKRIMVRMYELLINEFTKNGKYSVEWKRKLSPS
eukprot:scaffold15102_cov73-Skeletonema_marinoi.AAC.2